MVFPLVMGDEADATRGLGSCVPRAGGALTLP